MAVDNELSSVKSVFKPYTSLSVRTAFQPRERLVQVATNNSATFIHFPPNHRQSCVFVPICPSRISVSSTPVSSITTDTYSLSKSSTPDHTDLKLNHNYPLQNPILSNPLLNHRKEQPKAFPLKAFRPIRFGNSSKATQINPNDSSLSNTRASTAHLFVHQNNTNPHVSDRHNLIVNEKTSNDNYHPLSYIDDHKHDYIARWINEVRAATRSSNEKLSSRSKRTKRRFIET